MSPEFVRSRASHAAGSDGQLAKKTESGPYLWGQGLCRHNLYICLQHSNLMQAVLFKTVVGSHLHFRVLHVLQRDLSKVTPGYFG